MIPGHAPLPRTLAMASRFGAVGLVVAALYALGFALLVRLGLPNASASVLAYLAAIAVQFQGHRHVTFRVRGRPGRMARRFVVVNALGLAVSTALVVVLRDRMGLDALATGAAVSLALAAMNWIVFRKWVFRP